MQKKCKNAPYMHGKKVCYTDQSLFQMVEGLRYAFPRAMAKVETNCPRVVEVRERVAARPRLKKYLASPRRLPFNQNGIFRHYPELDE
jgi:glutathione S-transferase